MSEILECKGIVKKFKDKVALNDVDLTIEKGKIYGMIGRNGAGKTTLLSIMSGQSKATSGQAMVDGKEIWENKESIDKICFSREINTMTAFGPNNIKVKEMLKMASYYYPNWDKEMADRLIKLFELDVKKKISKLSKGMLSMITIIIALASKAEFTILDEPVAGLDVVARDEFYRLVIDEYNNSGRTFVISTHIIEEAEALFEEVIVIKDGKLLLKENTMDLLDRAYHINGTIEEVEEITKKYETYRKEVNGRGMGATILLKKDEKHDFGSAVNVQPVNLQTLFVALCGRD